MVGGVLDGPYAVDMLHGCALGIAGYEDWLTGVDRLQASDVVNYLLIRRRGDAFFLWGTETNLQLTDLKSIFHARCETVRIHGEEEVPHVGRSGLNIGSDNLQTDPHKYQDGHNDNNKLLYWGSYL